MINRLAKPAGYKTKTIFRKEQNIDMYHEQIQELILKPEALRVYIHGSIQLKYHGFGVLFTNELRKIKTRDAWFVVFIQQYI